MVHKDFPYTGVQDYLAECFDHVDRTVTDREVVEAKREYRRLYQTWYKVNRKDSHVQINFSLTKKEYRILQNTMKQSDMKLSVYIKHQLFKNGEPLPVHTFTSLSELILTLIDMLEEAMYEKTTSRLQEAVKIAENIEKLITP